MKSPDLEVNVVVSMENVTTRVQSAIKPGADEKQAFAARRADIERESTEKTGFRSDVVSLLRRRVLALSL